MDIWTGDNTDDLISNLMAYERRLASNIPESQALADVRALLDGIRAGRVVVVDQATRDTAQAVRDRAWGADVLIAYDLLAISWGNPAPRGFGSGIGYYFRRAMQNGFEFKRKTSHEDSSPVAKEHLQQLAG